MVYNSAHVFNNFHQINKSIELSRQQRLTPSILILIYSSIEIASSLSVDGDRDVRREDYINWVNTYLIPETNNSNLNGESLYGARCSVLHSLTSESSMSRRGWAIPISYIWGIETINELEGMKERAQKGEIIVLEIGCFIDSYNRSIQNFRNECSINSTLDEVVAKRGMNMFFGHEIK